MGLNLRTRDGEVRTNGPHDSGSQVPREPHQEIPTRVKVAAYVGFSVCHLSIVCHAIPLLFVGLQ